MATYQHPIADTCLGYVGDSLHDVDPIRYVRQFGDRAARAPIPDKGIQDMAEEEGNVQSRDDEEEQGHDEEYVAPPFPMSSFDKHRIHAHPGGHEKYA